MFLEAANQKQNYSAALPNAYNGYGAQRFPQSGHTHHYPPPNYPPNVLSPGMTNQRLQVPNLQQLPMHGSKSTVARVKKVPSSASSASSASSTSSSSSKKKKLDSQDLGKDKTMEGFPGQPVSEIYDQRSICVSDQTADHPKSNELSGMPSEFNQVRHVGPHYQQVHGPPNSLSSYVFGGPSFYGYDHGMPNAPNSQAPPTGYYHSSGMGPNPPIYPPRQSFSQQSYNPAMHYASGQQPQGASHDEQPPMYAQHISHPHFSRGGPPMLNQHFLGHPVPHPHNSLQNWHSSGPSYPSHGVSRYLPGPVGYSGYPRHFSHGSNICPVPHHMVSHQSTAVSMPDVNNGSQQIPAPPPYQQQPPQHVNSQVAYWNAHQMPPEFGQNQSQPVMPQQQPMPTPQACLSPSENNCQDQQAVLQTDNIHTVTTISGSNQDPGLAQVGNQLPPAPGMYYSG